MSGRVAQPLPGGYKEGDKVFFTGAGQTFPTGDKIVHGQQVEVVGPATNESVKGKGVAVLFPGITAIINCYLTMSAASAPPPLPPLACAPHTPCVPRSMSSRCSPLPG